MGRILFEKGVDDVDRVTGIVFDILGPGGACRQIWLTVGVCVYGHKYMIAIKVKGA